jgi:signal transduction histidine kinase
LLLVILATLCVAPGEVRAQDQTQVLILYGTRRDANISVLGDSRLPQLLRDGLSAEIDYYSEHVELARFREETYAASLANFLEAKYRDKQFDVVVAMHEITLQFAVRYRDRLFPRSPIVFSSNLGDVARPPNSTGVVYSPNFAATVPLALALQPGLQNLFVVTGSDPRDQRYALEARAALGPFESRLAVHHLNGLPTPDLKERLRTLPPRSAVYYVLVNGDASGHSFHPLEYLDEIAPVSNAPIYSWVDSTMGRGIVGGNLKSQEKQIEAIAGLTVRVLRGEAADSIPIARPDLHVPQVDWRQLRQWGIDGSRVPAGTAVLYETPSAWDQYKPYIVGGLILLLAQAALISVLLVQRRKLGLAEAATQADQVKLQDSYQRIRALGSRLLQAQETERAHIARELHDDISQQLALLSIDLQLTNWESGAEDDPAGGPLDRLQKITHSVHELSHRLHPAKLRLIGLTAALHGLQRELSRSDVEVHLLCENVPASLPGDVSLCLYRVVQEALQNAIKHSGARRVTVRLIGSDDRLSLSVADDGIGFDVEAALGTGLGLISMRERLEAVGSEVRIHSAPGAGTRIDVEVRLRSDLAAAAEAV